MAHSGPRPIGKRKFSSITLSVTILIFFIICLSMAVKADPILPVAENEAVENEISGNDACLTCHSNPNLEITLPSGERVNLSVKAEVYDQSIHGRLGLFCTACHKDITGFPHPPVDANTSREFSLALYPLCTECHEENYRETQRSVHRIALDRGNLDAAECVDCHGSHDISSPDQTRSQVAQTCRKCHSEVYNLYATSVHGEALLGQDNPDVPSCTDCHGVHYIQGPINSPYLLMSPQLCASCHDDPVMMGRYGINSQVMETYFADFHGETVRLLESTAPTLQTNKPVCVDCHTVHEIRKTDDPTSPVNGANILATCRKCHPNATANFPAAWLNHLWPSPEHAPIVFYVRWFYIIIIILIIGGMLGFVSLDYIRQIIDKIRGKRHA
jgi:predicted CXXCH cytochrome family protein